MKKLLLVAAIALFGLVGCGYEGQPVETNNPNVTLRLVSEHDGVKIYRLNDGFQRVYYAVPQGRTTWETGGKHRTYHSVDTVASNNDCHCQEGR